MFLMFFNIKNSSKKSNFKSYFQTVSIKFSFSASLGTWIISDKLKGLALKEILLHPTFSCQNQIGTCISYVSRKRNWWFWFHWCRDLRRQWQNVQNALLYICRVQCPCFHFINALSLYIYNVIHRWLCSTWIFQMGVFWVWIKSSCNCGSFVWGNEY